MKICKSHLEILDTYSGPLIKHRGSTKALLYVINCCKCIHKNCVLKIDMDMDSTDPQNHSEWRGRLRETLVKKPNPR